MKSRSACSLFELFCIGMEDSLTPNTKTPVCYYRMHGKISMVKPTCRLAFKYSGSNQSAGLKGLFLTVVSHCADGDCRRLHRVVHPGRRAGCDCDRIFHLHRRLGRHEIHEVFAVGLR